MDPVAAAAAQEAGVTGKTGLGYFIHTELPTGLRAFMVIVIISAAMSSIDTSMNASGMILAKNIFTQWTQRQSGLKGCFNARKVVKITAIVQTVLGILIALEFAKVDDFYSAFLTCFSIISGGVFGLFILLFFHKRISSTVGVVCLAVGMLVAVWMISPSWLEGVLPTCPLHPILANGVMGVVMLVIGTALIRILGKPPLEE